MVATRDTYPLEKKLEFYGNFGTDISGGIFNEEYLSTLKGPRAAREFDKMRTQDGQVKMVLTAVKNPIKSATWEIVSADSSDEAANKHREFVEFILFRDLNRTWMQTLSQMLTFVDFGHAVFEIIHKNVSNHPKFGSYTGIKSLAWRSQKTIEEWKLDPGTGELAGVLQRTPGDFNNDVIIPAEFLFVLTMDLEGNDFSGTRNSVLRPMYGAYQIKQFLKKLKVIGHEKMTIGTPIGRAPEGATKQQMDSFASILQLYSSNEKQYILLPPGFEVEIKGGEFKANELEQGIEAENQEMVRAFLLNFLNLGQTGGGGSYALGQTQADFYLKGLQCIAQMICDEINCRLIPHIVALNFGEQAEYPSIAFSGIEDAGKDFSEMIANYVNVKAVVVDPTLRTFLRKLHRLPPEQEGFVPEEETEVEAEPADGDEPVSVIEEQPDVGGPDPQQKDQDSIDNSGAQELVDGHLNLTAFSAAARSTITKGAQGLEELMIVHMDFMSNKLIADLVSRFKQLPDDRKRRAVQKIQVGGVTKYKKELKAALAKLAAIATNEALGEAGLKLQKFADPLDLNDIKNSVVFQNLQPATQQRILFIVETVVNGQAGDLEKDLKFQFNNTVDTTLDPDVLEKDLRTRKEKTIQRLAGAGPISTASELVNGVRLDTLVSKEAQEAGIVAFEFFNPDPVSPVCKHLAGRVFAVDDKEAMRNAPPLHYNCKSTLKPIFADSSKAKQVSKEGLNITEGNQAERDKINNSIQFSDISRTVRQDFRIVGLDSARRATVDAPDQNTNGGNNVGD